MNVANPHAVPVDPNQPEAVAAFAQLTGIDPTFEWQMEPGEQCALIAILSQCKPKVAIEIGSRYGGSMQILSRFAQRVISVDIDPTCQERLGHKYPNAEFVTGDSKITFPPLMKKLEQEGAEVGFILIDGDHTAVGVQADIKGLLPYRPKCPMFVLMHDSFNPPVREGIRNVPWTESPYIYSVELDFVPGVLHRGGEAHREMWGGLALAIFLPEPRPRPFQVRARMDHFFQMAWKRSVHNPFDPPTLRKRFVRKMKKLLGQKVN